MITDDLPPAINENRAMTNEIDRGPGPEDLSRGVSGIILTIWTGLLWTSKLNEK